MRGSNCSDFTTGCKESQFHRLLFGQAVANNVLAQKPFQPARKNFLLSRIDYNSSVI